MWPRVVEIMFGCWLLASPFIFQDSYDRTAWWINDYVCVLLIWIFAFSSFHPKLKAARIGNIAVGLWLIAFGWFWGHPSPPPMQNDISVGLLLAMFAIIPNNINEPPAAWRRLAGEDAPD